MWADTGSRFAVGDRVCGFTFHGGLAEQAVVLEANAAVLPDEIDADVGSTLPGGYGTSYHALVDRAWLQEGETLLVLGASGGVGMAAVQIGAALGARVIAAVSSEEKAAAAMTAGAHDVIRYDQQPLRDAISQVTGGGVGVGYSQHGCVVVVADGAELTRTRLERVFTNDSGSGVMRHADAGYPEAREAAQRFGLKLPFLDR